MKPLFLLFFVCFVCFYSGVRIQLFVTVTTQNSTGVIPKVEAALPKIEAATSSVASVGDGWHGSQ